VAAKIIGKQEDIEGADGPPMYAVRVDGERLFFDADEIKRASDADVDVNEPEIESNNRAPRAGDNVLERADLDNLPNGSIVNGGGTKYTKDEKGVWRRDDRQSVTANDLWRDYGENLTVERGDEVNDAPAGRDSDNESGSSERATTDAEATGDADRISENYELGETIRDPKILEVAPTGSRVEDGEERSFTKNSRGEWVD